MPEREPLPQPETEANICTIDGVVHFAKWVFKANIKTQFHHTKEGIICFTERERDSVKKFLDQAGEKYTLEEIPVDKEAEEKCRDMKYSSRSEALEHIMGNKEPQTMEKMAERLKDMEAEIARLKK